LQGRLPEYCALNAILPTNILISDADIGKYLPAISFEIRSSAMSICLVALIFSPLYKISITQKNTEDQRQDR